MSIATPMTKVASLRLGIESLPSRSEAHAIIIGKVAKRCSRPFQTLTLAESRARRLVEPAETLHGLPSSLPVMIKSKFQRLRNVMGVLSLVVVLDQADQVGVLWSCRRDRRLQQLDHGRPVPQDCRCVKVRPLDRHHRLRLQWRRILRNRRQMESLKNKNFKIRRIFIHLKDLPLARTSWD